MLRERQQEVLSQLGEKRLEDIDPPPWEKSNEPRSKWQDPSSRQTDPPWRLEKRLTQLDDRGELRVTSIVTRFDGGGMHGIRVRVWFVTPQGEEFDFSSLRKGRIWTKLWELTGGIPITEDKDLIPIDIAVQGKPAIAAYLHTVHELSFESIADTLEVSEITARKYPGRFARES